MWQNGDGHSTLVTDVDTTHTHTPHGISLNDQMSCRSDELWVIMRLLQKTLRISLYYENFMNINCFAHESEVGEGLIK